MSYCNTYKAKYGKNVIYSWNDAVITHMYIWSFLTSLFLQSYSRLSQHWNCVATHFTGWRIMIAVTTNKSETQIKKLQDTAIDMKLYGNLSVIGFY